ncbi:hypothetical protein PO124_09155 [Bacillus licheniformis]|nr:hypothetical protein [Bacillus licheniformis]
MIGGPFVGAGVGLLSGIHRFHWEGRRL